MERASYLPAAATGNLTPTRARIALTGLAVYAALTAAAYWFGELYIAPWLPWFRAELAWLLPTGIGVDALELATVGRDHVIQLHAVTTMPLTGGGTTVPAGIALKSSTLQAYALHHAVIVYAVLAAWPTPSWRRRVLLLALGVPCVLVTTSLDIPFVLSGLLQDLVLANLAPEQLGTDPLVTYYNFLQGGGRVGLALAAALGTAVIAAGVRAANPAAQSAGAERGQ
jgi:hypothetical protein